MTDSVIKNKVVPTILHRDTDTIRKYYYINNNNNTNYKKQVEKASILHFSLFKATLDNTNQIRLNKIT